MGFEPSILKVVERTVAVPILVGKFSAPPPAAAAISLQTPEVLVFEVRIHA
jgi:uncharacterized membrane protein